MWPLCLVALLIHGDVAFDQHERALIQTGVDLLAIETEQRIRLTVRYDYDGGPAALRRALIEPTLLRLGWLDPKVALADRLMRVHVVAWTTQPRIFLIPERIAASSVHAGTPFDLVYTHVVMHELLHELGVDHVPDPRAVMWLNASPTLWLTDWDRVAIHNALDSRADVCDTHVLGD